jgi:mRNA interferase MazF
MIKNKIVLVPFPFDNFSTIKVRPAVCLTNTIGKYNHIVIAFISSRIPIEPLETDIIIKKKDISFKKTGLTVDSVIKIHKVVTIPKKLIKRELGQLDEYLQTEVDKSIKNLFQG